jgi:hypothetical protein
MMIGVHYRNYLFRDGTTLPSYDLILYPSK